MAGQNFLYDVDDLLGSRGSSKVRTELLLHDVDHSEWKEDRQLSTILAESEQVNVFKNFMHSLFTMQLNSLIRY